MSGSNDDVAIVGVVRGALLADNATSDVWTLVPAFRAFLDGASESSDEARWLASMQFAARQQTSASSGDESAMFARIAELLGGATARHGDAAVLASAAPLLVVGSEVPLALYEAVKRVVDEFVDKVAIKSLLPMVQLLGQLERRVDALGFAGEKAGEARDSVRACVRGAMYECVVKSYERLAERDVTLERGLETALLFVGVARQLEFFGGVPARFVDKAVAVVEEAVDQRLRGDDALRAKYASMPLRDLKRRLPWLFLLTPEFAAAAAAKLDRKVDDKRVKVILMGDTGAGKTQIRHRLSGVDFDPVHKSTDTAKATSVHVSYLRVGGQRWKATDVASNVARPMGVNAVLGELDAVAGERAAVPAIEMVEASSNSAFLHERHGGTQPVAAETVSATHASSGVAERDEVPLREPSDDDVADEQVLSMWDFCGQSEYFAVHDLFLTDGAVFVLVIDWTKGVEAARKTAQAWLDALRAHVKEPVVLPVLPRSDVEAIADVLMTPIPDDEKSDEWKLHTNLHDLAEVVNRQLSFTDGDSEDPGEAKCRRAAYKGLLSVQLRGVTKALNKLTGSDATVCVDSADGRNYDELKRKLLALADAQMAASGQVPLRWLQLHDELTELRANGRQWIARTEFKDKLRAMYGPTHEVTDEETRNALEYSKRVGTVLTTSGGERVREFVFLDPELFLQLVRPLITTSEQLMKRKNDAVASTKVVAEQRALINALEQFGATCVAARVLLKYMWRAVKSPTGEIGFFVELLEWCGLMCDLEAGKYLVPAASKATPSAGLALDWVAGAEQIALVCADEKIQALPASLLPRIVASLFKGGAIDKPNKQRIITLSDVVLLLRDDAGTDLRRVRLQQIGNRVVLTLQSGEPAQARAWRLRAYTALYAAVESVLQLVFGSVEVKASVLCVDCYEWRAATICSVCEVNLPSIDAWLPRDGDAIKPQRNDWVTVAPCTVTAAATRGVCFSASPQWKTPWKTEFERATDAIPAGL